MSGGKAGSLWENPGFLRELALSFHDIAAASGGLSAENKKSVEEMLKANGYDMTWNALRQHVAKLRKARDNGGGSAVSTPTKGTPKKTPAKRAAPGSGRKKGAAPAVKTQESDDDEGIENPFQVKSEGREDEQMGDAEDYEESPSKRTKIERSLADSSRDDEI